MIRIDPSDKQEFWAEPLTGDSMCNARDLDPRNHMGLTSHICRNKTSSIWFQDSGYSGENKWKRPALGTPALLSTVGGVV